ncbi:hypothetical protein JAAARDRAFT_62874 [Jaapia argillacea MUCL 33604]|uniref:F-box domain-containing protein n=1 Tax=Jaapia argillacea MUCL 33604 TaxID=933084 RepID=A0A067P7Y4_9AGAM|nr:hypothetical protein JAAARDRAFT_62874 [Jaapia argillacea MUCL 33604]
MSALAQEWVLAVPELFLEICWYLKPWPTGSGTRGGTLAHLARCCRRFMNPALDVLWCELENMRPLLDLIPAAAAYLKGDQVVYEDDEDEDDVHHIFFDPPEEKDWARFDFYGRRVRMLHFDHSPEYMQCEIFSQLAECRVDHLLPNLRHLYWYHGYMSNLNGAFLAEVTPFLTPLLQTICVGCSDDDLPRWQPPAIDTYTLKLFLHMLPQRCPSTRYLQLRGFSLDVPLTPFGQFKHLQCLDLDEDGALLDGSTLDTLAGIGTLETLTGIIVTKDSLSRSSLPGFPSLRTLRIRKGNPEGTFTLLNRISSSSLSSFEADDMIAGDRNTFLACFTSLQRFSQTLQEVSYHTRISFLKSGDGLSALEACFGLHHLTTLNLFMPTTGQSPALLPAYAESMARSWPHIMELNLSYGRFSLQSLWTFVSQSPHLHTFKIHTLSVPDNLGTVAKVLTTSPHQELQWFSISHYSPDEDKFDFVALAAILDRLFPNFQSQSWYGPRGKVMGAVASLQTIRRAMTDMLMSCFIVQLHDKLLTPIVLKNKYMDTLRSSEGLCPLIPVLSGTETLPRRY